MNKFNSLLFILMTVVLSGCFPNNSDATKQEIAVQGRTMGTTYTVKVVGDQSQVESQQLQQQIDNALIKVNQQMSTYIPDSELMQFNNNATTEPVSVSPEIALVVKEAIRLGQMSSGKLDVTVGPLVNLWGFGPDKRPERIPSPEEVEEARARIGIEKITLEGLELSKSVANLYIDLSTIAKGYGVDVVADLLEQNGYQNYLVEIGGEMRLKGFKANGTLWHVAVERPSSDGRAVHQVIVPKDNAVATSGDYRNYIEVDGKRYSHIIDPQTNLPIDHTLVSVTVIHPSSMTADGLSTAMMVMGPEKALEFAEHHQIAAYLISKSDNGFIEQSTVKFMPFLK